MKTVHPFLIILTIFFFSGNVEAQVHTDKLEHFISGALISGSAQVFAVHITDNRNQSTLIGFGAGLFAGAVKELYDLSGHGCASYKDLFWTTVGAGFASVSLHYSIQAKSRIITRL